MHKAQHLSMLSIRSLIGLVMAFGIHWVLAQSTDFPINHPAYQMIDFEEIRSEKSFTSVIKPYSRQSAYDFLGQPNGTYLSRELRRFSHDSTRSKKAFLNTFYRYPADAIYHQDKTLQLHVNPVGQLSLGLTSDNIGSTFVTTRGLEVRGTLDNKVSFYSILTENQARYPAYVNDIRDSTLVVPFEGFWKQYNDTGVDFLRAQGYVDFGLSRSISAQLGFGKHFIGNGQRSLILSNYANNYPYLRINTNTKIFDYTNIFAELIGGVNGNAGGTFGIQGFNKKYMAFHHLNIKVKPNLHIGLFESVMYGDSTGGLKVAYMNPIIFYRSVEQQNGSEDNAFVGLDFKWNVFNRYSFYGQLLIDELIVSEVLGRNGWWGNKQGFQLGLKYADAFGLENLMVQGEVNRVRPYTYAHEDAFTSYSHYNLALAHPLGANFTEYLGRAVYQLSDQWLFDVTALYARYGNDIRDENFGRDILKDYTIRRNVPNPDFGNDHLQGNKVTLLMLFSRVTFMPKHNLFIDLDMTYRGESDQNGIIDANSAILGLSFRWNMPARKYLF